MQVFRCEHCERLEAYGVADVGQRTRIGCFGGQILGCATSLVLLRDRRATQYRARSRLDPMARGYFQPKTSRPDY